MKYSLSNGENYIKGSFSTGGVRPNQEARVQGPSPVRSHVLSGRLAQRSAAPCLTWRPSLIGLALRLLQHQPVNEYTVK